MKTTEDRRALLRIGGAGLGALIVAVVSIGETAAEGHVRVEAGVRSLSGTAWEGIGDQAAGGITIDYRKATWPVRVAVGWYESEGEETVTEWVPDGGLICFIFCVQTHTPVERTVTRGSIREFSPGVDKVWGGAAGRVHGYVGGGPAFVKVSLMNAEAGVDDADGTVGLWAHTGFFYRTDPVATTNVRFTLGLEARALTGTGFKMTGQKGDADYVQTSLTTGVSW